MSKKNLDKQNDDEQNDDLDPAVEQIHEAFERVANENFATHVLLEDDAEHPAEQQLFQLWQQLRQAPSVRGVLKMTAGDIVELLMKAVAERRINHHKLAEESQGVTMPEEVAGELLNIVERAIMIGYRAGAYGRFEVNLTEEQVAMGAQKRREEHEKQGGTRCPACGVNHDDPDEMNDEMEGWE